MSNTEATADMVSKALRRAWQLGQTYWQQADSESYSANKRADATAVMFAELVNNTLAALAQPAASGEPADPDPLHLSRILHEMAGAVSLCWEPRPSGVFESSMAAGYVAAAIAEIRSRMPAASGEPLAMLERGEGGAFKLRYVADNLLAIYALPPGNHLLYTSPQPAPARVPLTDAQIQAAWDAVDMRHPRGDATRTAAFARAIEAAHGITGEAP